MLFAAWFPWMLAHQVYPATWAFFTKLKFGWSDGLIGLSFAFAGLSMALAQVFLTRRIIPAIGERRAIVLGLTVGATGFLANAFAPHGWMVFVVLTLSALQGLVFPSMNATLSRLVAANEQGELQGAVASLSSAAAICGPPLLSGVLSHFTRESAPVRFPGAAFVVASCLALTALAIVTVFARDVFAPRQGVQSEPRSAG